MWLLLIICFVLKLRERHIIYIYIYIYNLYTHLCLSQHLRGASFFPFFVFFLRRQERNTAGEQICLVDTQRAPVIAILFFFFFAVVFFWFSF